MQDKQSQNNDSARLDEAINIVLDGDRVEVAKRIIRAVYVHTGRDAEAIVYGTSMALFEHDEELAESLEQNMLDVLETWVDRMN